MEESNLKPPLGKFIIDNAEGVQAEDGVYYHYEEVLKLLRLYNQDNFQNEGQVQYRLGRNYTYIGQHSGKSVVFDNEYPNYFALPTEDLRQL